jgi:hypothetical protein
MFFCVVGYLHPRERYTSYLKYIPSPDGKWSRGKTRYSRTLNYYDVSQVENTYKFLKEAYSDYLYDCPVRNIEITAVPKDHVKRYYQPQKRLKSVKANGPKDSLEEKLLELTNFIEQKTGRTGILGVTGSILTRSHNPKFSDIDLTVYGYEASENVKQVVQDAVQDNNLIQGPSEEERRRWIKTRESRSPLSYNELEKISSKRWNYGYYNGTYFSIHPTRNDEEITESYGDLIYRKVGEIQANATILEKRESMFLPAIYDIGEVETVCEISDVKKLVSYEGLYSGIFEIGEHVEFKGTLEKVSGKENYHRVIIGGAGSRKDYVKWV